MTGDRYPVNPLDDTAAFAEWQRNVEQRISALEGSPITGTMRVRGPGGTFDVFHVDEDGMDAPQFPLPQNWVPDSVASFVSVAPAAGFALVSRTILPVIVAHAAVRILVGWSFSDAATTGQFRVRSFINVPGADTVVAETIGPTLPAASAGTERLDWLHQLPLGVDSGTFYYLDVYARTLAGAGSIRAYEPSVTMCSPVHGATVAGTWSTLVA